MNVESPAYMKVHHHLMDFRILGYLLVHKFFIRSFFFFLSARFLYLSRNMPSFPIIFQNGASYCTSELSVLKNNEIHTSDRGYDDDGNQVSVDGSVFYCKYL